VNQQNGKYSERCEILADYLIRYKDTVRGAAGKFGISKSTVHKDVTQKLRSTNSFLYEEVKELLDLNKAERHIRGGEATKRKYEEIKGQLQKDRDADALGAAQNSIKHDNS